MRLWPLIILLAGCQAHQAQNIQVVWHSGECFLMVDNLSVEQAAEIQKEWHMEYCKVEVKTARQ